MATTLHVLVQGCLTGSLEPIIKYVHTLKNLPADCLRQKADGVTQVLATGLVASSFARLSQQPGDKQLAHQLHELCVALSTMAVLFPDSCKCTAAAVDYRNTHDAIQSCMPFAHDLACIDAIMSGLCALATSYAMDEPQHYCSLMRSKVRELRDKLLLTTRAAEIGALTAFVSKLPVLLPVVGMSEAAATMAAVLAERHVTRALLLQLESAVTGDDNTGRKLLKLARSGGACSNAVRMLACSISDLHRALVLLSTLCLAHGSKDDVDAVLALMAALPQDAELMACVSRCLTALDSHAYKVPRDAERGWELIGILVATLASSLAFVSGGSTGFAIVPTYWMQGNGSRKLDLDELFGLYAADQQRARLICDAGIRVAKLLDRMTAEAIYIYMCTTALYDDCKREAWAALVLLLHPIAKSLDERLYGGKKADDGATADAKRLQPRVLRMLKGVLGASLRQASSPSDTRFAMWQLTSGLYFACSTDWYAGWGRQLLLVQALETLVLTVREYVEAAAASCDEDLGVLVTLCSIVRQCRTDFVEERGLMLPEATGAILQLSALGLRLAAVISRGNHGRLQAESVALLVYEIGNLLFESAGSVKEHAGLPELRQARLEALAATAETAVVAPRGEDQQRKNVAVLMSRVLSSVVARCQGTADERLALLQSLGQHRLAMNARAADGAADVLGARMHAKACLKALKAGLEEQQQHSGTLVAAALCSQLLPPVLECVSALTARRVAELPELLQLLLDCVTLLQQRVLEDPCELGGGWTLPAAIRACIESGLPALLAAMSSLQREQPSEPLASGLVSAVQALHAGVGGRLEKDELVVRPDLAELMSVLCVPGCHNPMCRRCDEPPQRMLCCRGCLKVRYCSEACAREAWNGHGARCENVPTQSSSNKALHASP